MKNAGQLTDDPRDSQYRKALAELKECKHPVVPEIEHLETQSKLARSVSLFFLLFAGVLTVRFSWLLAATCFLLSFYMWYTFCKFRWEASELVYKSIHKPDKGLMIEQDGPANGSQPFRSE